MTQTIGFFLYQGKHTTQQVHNIKNYFTFLLTEEKFDVIIEMGTSLGGLTYILDDIVKEYNLPHNIHTFDIGYRDYVETFLKERGCVYHILDEHDDIFKETIIDLLSNHGKALLLCDGGYKIEEFNRYSEFLKSGDIIMAHDYSKNSDVFNTKINNKIWNWCEITYKDIEQSVIKNNLSEYEKIDFSYAVWCCFYKN